MGQYIAPLRDIQFILHELLDVNSTLKQLPPHSEIDIDLINQILEEAGKFSSEVLFPLNHTGDQEGCQFNATTHQVTTPSGFKKAYQEYVNAGWPALSCDPQYGGQGLPVILNNTLLELLNSANQAWTMYPGLSRGAYECLLANASEEQKQLYLPKLSSGEWTGTMCLTEAHCGTDLGLLRTKASPQPDGSYYLTGSKIFISAGEHDLTENIIHLVLARLPDAPEGSKGISLFVVPKIIPNTQERNSIVCSSIEKKMGIHANATCQMNMDNARGWLVGQPNKGLNAMFVMMNAARLGVGMQSLGLTEVAYQNALIYAKDRLQMRSLSGIKAPDKPADPIIVHPDVRRMLFTAKAYAEGGRALSAYIALKIDIELNHPDEKTREQAANDVALLTPIAKAFLTDNGWIATSECLQVFGGHGYITEYGMEQYVRDARINMIYEGTNTIQSLDLLGRKILSDNGTKLRSFGKEIEGFIKQYALDENMSEFITPLIDLLEKVNKLTLEIGMKALKNPDEVGAAAVPYLRVLGHLMYSYLFAKMAKIALAPKHNEPFYQAKLATIRFYFARLYPETASLIRQARSGAHNLMSLDASLF